MKEYDYKVDIKREANALLKAQRELKEAKGEAAIKEAEENVKAASKPLIDLVVEDAVLLCIDLKYYALHKDGNIVLIVPLESF